MGRPEGSEPDSEGRQVTGWIARHPQLARALSGERLLLVYIAVMVTLAVLLGLRS